MAEYHSLIARAIEGLENNTGEARRALYERARAALVAQLRSVTPALSESDITRERLGLEEAIRKVEAEHARRGRLERPLPMGRPAAPPESPPPESPPPRDQDLPEPPIPDAPVEQRPAAPPPRQPMTAAPPDVVPAPEMPAPPPAFPESMQQVARDRRPGPPDDQLPDVDRPPMPRPAPPPPPVELGRRAAAVSDLDSARLDEALRALRNRSALGQEEVVPRWPRMPPHKSSRGEREAQGFEQAEAPSHRPGQRHEPDADDVASRAEHEAAGADYDLGAAYPDHPVRERSRRRLSGAAVKIVIAIVVIAVLGALAAVGYRERASLIALYHLFSGPPPVTSEQVRTPPKIEDRVGGPAQPDRLPGADQRASGPATQPPPAVAQRVVLYEEDPNNPAGKRYVGSVIWRTETVSPGPGLAPELAVKANIEIPERRITMAFSMVRNTDPALPASHTIDVRFNLPPGFSGGGVANVPGILMKQAEQTRGVPLAGIAVKVTNNVFLIGLSSVDTDVQRNTQLLKERTWFDIPIVYSNGSRAILAMEKGTPGERAFNDAFTAWGSTGVTGRGARQ